MKRILSTVLFTFLIFNLFAATRPLQAQDSGVSDDEVNEVARDIYCPVCENTPLDVCATQACADWRELIRTKLAEGQSPQEIFDYFARQYGDGVLANPPRRGVSLIILWVLPVVVVLLGALLFSRYLSNLRAASATVPSSVAPDDPGGVTSASAPPTTKAAESDYLSRIEEEVSKS
jgi:cytochrome c-type biogenesis protein CcmH